MRHYAYRRAVRSNVEEEVRWKEYQNFIRSCRGWKLCVH